MPTYRHLLACMLCSVAHVATAQLTARDSAALVDALADRIAAQYGTASAREPFVIVARNAVALPDVRFAARVSAAVQARDSLLISTAPTQSTKRMVLGPVGLVTADTAAVALWIAWCKGTPAISGWHDASLAFLHVGDHWVFVERNVGGSGGASNGCSW